MVGLDAHHAVGLDAIGRAASPGAGCPGASNSGTGGSSQVLVAGAVWARAGVSASRSPLHVFCLFFSIFSPNLSAACLRSLFTSFCVLLCVGSKHCSWCLVADYYCVGGMHVLGR